MGMKVCGLPFYSEITLENILEFCGHLSFVSFAWWNTNCKSTHVCSWFLTLFLAKITVALMTSIFCYGPQNLLIFFLFSESMFVSKCPRLLVPSIKRHERGSLSFSCNTHKHLRCLCPKNMATVVKACLYNPPVRSAQDWGRLSQGTFLWSTPVSEFLEHWIV